MHKEGEFKYGYYRLTAEQIKQLFEIGYTHVMIEEKIIRVTKEQALYKKEDIDKIISEVKSADENNEGTNVSTEK